VGTPAAVAERLGCLAEELGLGGVMAELNCDGLIPHEREFRALELLCREVLPQFR